METLNVTAQWNKKGKTSIYLLLTSMSNEQVKKVKECLKQKDEFCGMHIEAHDPARMVEMLNAIAKNNSLTQDDDQLIKKNIIIITDYIIDDSNKDKPYLEPFMNAVAAAKTSVFTYCGFYGKTDNVRVLHAINPHVDIVIDELCSNPNEICEAISQILKNPKPGKKLEIHISDEEMIGRGIPEEGGIAA